MSQEHNALSWPGLEPRSSDLEPSALTTEPPDKAMALACLWHSWPRMLKVAPCMVIRSYSRMGVRSYNQIFLAWWVTTILYNYGATLCKLCYKSYFFIVNQKLTKWSSQEIEIEKEAQKKSQAWTGFKLSCDRHKLNPYQSLEKASFPITILIAV